ncbi:hypothetical protein CYMTET_48112 [Cymbomonas tetramitiformis]|uniref:Uncharacterized protein n=1 Tax=Cymbomonas tetramitiformis TaxID=36881 RepID=A0AAE0BU74_9CHLO|nr:hypothetical protein CYMTET_48112 [Cymbomonas tetramitiformis]|eukprot:gene1253-1831_t
MCAQTGVADEAGDVSSGGKYREAEQRAIQLADELRKVTTRAAELLPQFEAAAFELKSDSPGSSRETEDGVVSAALLNEELRGLVAFLKGLCLQAPRLPVCSPQQEDVRRNLVAALVQARQQIGVRYTAARLGLDGPLGGDIAKRALALQKAQESWSRSVRAAWETLEGLAQLSQQFNRMEGTRAGQMRLATRLREAQNAARRVLSSALQLEDDAAARAGDPDSQVAA